MTLTIHRGETQRAFVERTLRDQGRISAHEAMFALVTEAGNRASITRLAPVIETLRKAGWRIRTEVEHGVQATYHLEGAPTFGHPIGAVRECPSCHHSHPVGTTCSARNVA